jgi:prolyl oligopeptidase
MEETDMNRTWITLAVAVSLSGAAGAQSPLPAADDPYGWLEDVGGEKPLSWAKERNAEAEKELAVRPSSRR